MVKSAVADWSTTAGNNTDVGGINIAEGCAPANINNAIREMMKQVADWSALVGQLADNETVSGDWTFSGDANFTGAFSIGGTALTATATELNLLDGITAFLDEDDLASDSDTGIPSQQSVKAYVDALSTVYEAKTFSLGTVSTATGVTEIEFTSIPAGVNEITLTMDGVSLSGTDSLLVQIGDSGGYETTGYDAVLLFNNSTTNTRSTETAGFYIGGGGASVSHTAVLKLTRMTGNKWQISGTIDRGSGAFGAHATGVKTLSAELDRVRWKTSGTDTIDANSGVNISYR